MKKKLIITMSLLLLIFSIVGLYGDNTQPCFVCNGTGKIVLYCIACGGMGGYLSFGYYTRCAVCSGAGKSLVNCSYCGGTGKIKVAKSPPAQNKPFTPMPAPIAPVAPGAGGTGNRIQCKACDGTGKCRICGGVSEIKCKYCEGIGKTWQGYGSNRTFETCSVCRGKGYNLCPASGYTCMAGKCSSCGGRGYL